METIINGIKSVAEKLNLFTVLQATWLVEFYLLSVLSIKDLLINISVDEIQEPEVLTFYLDKIILWISEYEMYIFYIVIALFFTGMIGALVSRIPLLGQHMLIVKYADYGLYAGIWLFLIAGTYWLFMKIKIWTLLMFIIIWGLFELLKRFEEKITGPYCM